MFRPATTRPRTRLTISACSRSCTTPAAYRFPERGFGVEQYRERLKKAGIDPDQIGTQQQFGVLQARPPMQPPSTTARAHSGDAPTDNPAHYLGLLEELHDTGVLDDDEYTAARTRLLESLRS